MLSKWEKQGLIFQPKGQRPWLVSHAAVPVADRIGENLYRIYFAARDNAKRSRIGSFDIDVANAQFIPKLNENPLLELGRPGAFDDAGTMPSWMVNHRGIKYLYYVGWNLSVAVPFRNAIGLAMSHDGGATFMKHSEGPILDRGVHDPCFAASCCVLVEYDRWRMWYLSCIKWEFEGDRPKHFYHIKYAESDDGIRWGRNGVVCIDFKSEDEYAISRPSVIKEDGIYKMWYSYRGASYRIGYAESADGLRWERKDEEAGIDISDRGWDSEMIEYPYVFEHKGIRYMLYNGNDYGKTGIGYAVLP